MDDSNNSPWFNTNQNETMFSPGSTLVTIRPDYLFLIPARISFTTTTSTFIITRINHVHIRIYVSYFITCKIREISLWTVCFNMWYMLNICLALFMDSSPIVPWSWVTSLQVSQGFLELFNRLKTGRLE